MPTSVRFESWPRAPVAEFGRHALPAGPQPFVYSIECWAVIERGSDARRTWALRMVGLDRSIRAGTGREVWRRPTPAAWIPGRSSRFRAGLLRGGFSAPVVSPGRLPTAVRFHLGRPARRADRNEEPFAPVTVSLPPYLGGCEAELRKVRELRKLLARKVARTGGRIPFGPAAPPMAFA